MPHRARVEPTDAGEGARGCLLQQRDRRRPRGRRRGRGQGESAPAPKVNTERAGAGRTLAVRVNGVGTPWWRDDVARRRGKAIRDRRPEGGIGGRGRSRRRAPAGGGRRPRGADRDEHAGSSRWSGSRPSGRRLERWSFGPGDVAASLGVPVLTIGERRVRVRVGAHRGRGPRVRAPGGRRPLRGAARSRRAACVGGACARTRLRRQVGDPQRADRAGQRGLHSGRRPSSSAPHGFSPPRTARLPVDGDMVDAATKRLAAALVARAR